MTKSQCRRAHIREASLLVLVSFGLVSVFLGGCVNPPEQTRSVSAELKRRAGVGLREYPTNRFELPPKVAIDDGLSEEEATALALWNNAAFQELLADLDLSRSDLVQAGMLPNPTFSMLIP